MKMLVAIVNEKYLEALLDRFLEENILITKVSSTGGFLNTKNVTIILSVEAERLDQVKSIFKDCVNSEDVSKGSNTYHIAGANIFVLDIDRDLKY